jgi:hypothetical protein
MATSAQICCEPLPFHGRSPLTISSSTAAAARGGEGGQSIVLAWGMY